VRLLHEMAGEFDEIFQPQRFIAHVGAEGAQLRFKIALHEKSRRNDSDRDVADAAALAESTQKPQTIDERHAQVEQDGVGRHGRGVAQSIATCSLPATGFVEAGLTADQ